MAIDIFNSLFEHINTTVIDVIANQTSQIMNVFKPLILTGFTIYVIFIAMSYIQGSNLESTMFDLIKRIVAWGAIVTFSLNISAYNSTVVPMVMGLGDGLAKAFSHSSGSIGSELDTIISTVLKAYETTYAELDPSITNIGLTIETIFLTGLLIVATVLFSTIAFAYILVAKLMCALLAIVGPVFISLALFPATRQFFSSWLNQVVTSGLTIFFMNVIIGVMVTYLMNMVSKVPDGNWVLGIGTVLSFAISCVIFFIVILKIPELASGLGGGISNNGFQQAVTTVKGAMGGMKAVGGAGKSEKKGGSVEQGK